MPLPVRFPFKTIVLYDGHELPVFDKCDEESLKKVDPYFKERDECKERFKKEVSNPFSLFEHKYFILKNVLNKGECPKNISVFNILEDSLRQNICDFSELMSIFMKFVNTCQGKYSILFKKNAQSLIFKNLEIDKSEEIKAFLKERNKEIDLKREALFGQFNQQGVPSSNSFDDLKLRIITIRNKVKIYRDTIGAHSDSTQFSIELDDINDSIVGFKELISGFYIVFSFEKWFKESEGPGLECDQAIKVLELAIY